MIRRWTDVCFHGSCVPVLQRQGINGTGGDGEKGAFTEVSLGPILTADPQFLSGSEASAAVLLLRIRCAHISSPLA